MAARPSRAKQVPPEIKVMIDRLLREGKETQLAILDMVNTELEVRGQKPLSRSSLNRYALQIDKAGAKIRQAREIAAIWMDKLGTSPDNQTGRLVIELIRTMAFESVGKLSEQADESGEPLPPKILNELAKMARNLELAERTSVEADIAVRKQVAEEVAAAARQAEDQVVAVATEAGLSAARIAEMRAGFLGVRVNVPSAS